MDFKTYTALKRGLILLVIFSMITILDRQMSWKMPFFYCIGKVFVYKQNKINKIQANPKTAADASTATNATSNISNTSLTSTATASDSTTSSFINANEITVCSQSTLHHLVFLLLHFLFPIKNSELASISIVCPIRCHLTFHIQPTKSLPALRLIR